jgi:hypothetical protein
MKRLDKIALDELADLVITCQDPPISKENAIVRIEQIISDDSERKAEKVENTLNKLIGNKTLLNIVKIFLWLLACALGYTSVNALSSAGVI